MVFMSEEILYIPTPVLAPNIQTREQVHIILEEFLLQLLALSRRFRTRRAEYLQLVSVDGISYGLRSLQQAFSDEVVKLQLTHFVYMREVVYSSRWCDLLGVEYQEVFTLLYKWIPEVFYHVDHRLYIFQESSLHTF